MRSIRRMLIDSLLEIDYTYCMSLSRRSLARSLALGGGLAGQASAQQSSNDLGIVAAAHGVNLSEERGRVLRPVMERRKTQLKALRDFDVKDSVGINNGRL